MINKNKKIIRALLSAAGQNFDEVASAIGVSRKSVTRWYNGDCEPQFSIIVRLCELARWEIGPSSDKPSNKADQSGLPYSFFRDNFVYFRNIIIEI